MQTNEASATNFSFRQNVQYLSPCQGGLGQHTDSRMWGFKWVVTGQFLAQVVFVEDIKEAGVLLLCKVQQRTEMRLEAERLCSEMNENEIMTP